MTTLRIAYLVSRYPAFNHTFVLREVRRLRALGFDVRVASVSAADRAPEAMTVEEQEEARATFYIKPRGVARSAASHARVLARHPVRYARALAAALALAGADARRVARYMLYFAEAVVFAEWMEREGLGHFHTHFSSTVALIVARAFPFEMSITMHGPGEFDEPAGFHLAEKVAAARFVAAISSYGRSQLMLRSHPDHWPKIRVARLGIDPAVFEPRPFRVHPHPFEIVCIGRLASVKAQLVLVDAVARLVERGRDVRLRLVGDGPDRERLERAVDARRLGGTVVFEGWQNQDRVREIYRAADAFALASFAEGVPVVLMEAMACEIPCVATRITGVPELIEDGVDGLLVAPADAAELAAALERLVEDPELRLRLGRAGRRRVLEQYDLEANVERLAQLLREHVSRRGVEARSDAETLRLATERSVGE